MATKVYKPKRKISATESEEIKIPASSVDGLSTVATSGSYNDLSNKPTIPDVSDKANLTGGNTFTGKQTLTSPPSDGYSIDASGYVKGSWLQAPSTGKAGSNTGKVCVLDGSGWVYYRTPAEIVSDGGGAKASDIPTNYVTTNTAQDITAEKKFLNTLIVGAKDDGSTGFKVIQGDIAGGDTLFTVSVNGIDLDAHEHNIPLLIGGNAGTSGQVLTSRGAGNAPIWADVSGGGSSDNSKHGYTQLTNENLNTITEAGWYRAASGNTCTNRPSVIGSNSFVLEVEKSADTYIKQTIYTTGNSAAAYYVANVRYSSNSGSSWYSWYKQQTLSDGYTQTFSARKTFSDGISISNSLQFRGDAGSSSQFAMSQGSSLAPKWVNLQVKVNGTTYTADSSGLIDLGTISGGGSTSSSQYNDIY